MAPPRVRCRAPASPSSRGCCPCTKPQHMVLWAALHGAIPGLQLEGCPKAFAIPPPPPTPTHPTAAPQNYPEEGQKVLGFLTGRIIWALQWDHIYTADYFLLLLGLLGASLAACTYTNQWPAVKVGPRPGLIGRCRWQGACWPAGGRLGSSCAGRCPHPGCALPTRRPQVAQRWRFKGDEASLARLQVSARLPNAALSDVAQVLAAKQYQVNTGPA